MIIEAVVGRWSLVAGKPLTLDRLQVPDANDEQRTTND